jgi:O-antigen/teichoic acid export membrane protein
MSSEARILSAVQQPERSSLRVDFSWMFVGNAVYACGQWITLILLTKLIRPEFVGQYALSLAIVYPVIALTSFQLRAVVASDIYRHTHFGHYLSLRLLTTALALIIVFAITRILGFSWELTAVVLTVAVVYAIETVSDIYYARLQLHDRIVRISHSLIARTLLSVFGLTVGIYLGRSLFWGIAGIMLARATVLLGYDARKRTHDLTGQSMDSSRSEALKPRWHLKVQRELLWFSFPLGILTLLVTLNSSIPSYFIKHALGERELGIFSTIGFMVSAGSVAVLSLGQSAFTRLARAYAAENVGEFWATLGKLLALGATVGACGVILSKVAGQEILTIAFRREYAERADLLPWVMAAGTVGYMGQFLCIGMTAARYYHSQIVLLILVSLSLSVTGYLLIPRHGLLGAIFSMLVAAIVQLAGSFIILFIGTRTRCGVRANGVGQV